MLSPRYIEDIFLSFCDLFRTGKIPVQPHDVSVIVNFESVIDDDKGLTSNQANFLLKILKKYQNFCINEGFDYSSCLANPEWKQEFRVLDLSKKIFVYLGEDDIIWVCAKFPYQLKKQFDEEFSSDPRSWLWDQNQKVRKNRLYDTNLIALFEYARNNSFEIDDSFLNAMSQIEEIWHFQDDIICSSVIKDGQVRLRNAHQDAINYFSQKTINNLPDDLLLAKTMGFFYKENPKNTIEKICASENNLFWIKTFDEYFHLIKTVQGKIVIVIDNPSKAFEWLQNFSSYAEKFEIPAKEVKVCFRSSKEEDQNINEWIKEKGYGGKVEEGKILIFLQKPAKWLFGIEESVKIITSTSLYPSPNPITRDFFDSHSCVIYLGNIKPSEKKDQRIVEL